MHTIRMRPSYSVLPLLSSLLLLPQGAHAEQIVQPNVLVNTENAVFLDDGRYFVAGSAGIHEIKPQSDPRPACYLDPLQDLTVCTVVSPDLDGNVCLYTGMTTDGETLYAACAIYDDAPLAILQPPGAAVLFRIRPEGDGYDVETTYLEDPAHYNGMAMVDGDTLLASRSHSGSITNAPGPAIDRIDVTDDEGLTVSVSPWLPSSSAYLFPNGIQIDNGYAYFIGGQNVFRIRIRKDGSAGIPVLLYQTALIQDFDDFTIVGDYLAIAEIAILNGLGVNSITFVRKTGSLFPQRIPTGTIQLSSLAVDPGTFGTPGALIGTSYFQGGIHRF